MIDKVKRIYPESKTALIKWIEDNFHDIDEYVAVFEMKDGTQMTIYDFYSYRNAKGTIEMASEGLYELSRNDDFIVKKKD
jgi:hypothetical protein